MTQPTRRRHKRKLALARPRRLSKEYIAAYLYAYGAVPALGECSVCYKEDEVAPWSPRCHAACSFVYCSYCRLQWGDRSTVCVNCNESAYPSTPPSPALVYGRDPGRNDAMVWWVRFFLYSAWTVVLLFILVAVLMIGPVDPASFATGRTGILVDTGPDPPGDARPCKDLTLAEVNARNPRVQVDMHPLHSKIVILTIKCLNGSVKQFGETLHGEMTAVDKACLTDRLPSFPIFMCVPEDLPVYFYELCDRFMGPASEIVTGVDALINCWDRAKVAKKVLV